MKEGININPKKEKKMEIKWNNIFHNMWILNNITHVKVTIALQTYSRYLINVHLHGSEVHHVYVME